jgi:uncharacterized protein
VAFGLSRLRLDTQVLNLLPESLPSVQGLRLYEEHFANANELLVVLKGEDPSRLQLAARELAARFRSLTNTVSDAFWTPPWLEHPEQTAELTAYLWLNQPTNFFADLIERLAHQNLQNVLEEAKTRLANSFSPDEIGKLSYDPFGLLDLPGANNSNFAEEQDFFVNSEGTLRVIFVQSRGPLRSFTDCQQFMRQMQGVVEQWQSETENRLEIAFTGRPAFVTEISANMEKDIQTSAGGTLIIIASLFWLAHRRFLPLVWLVCLLFLILLTTLAFAGLLFSKLNIISIGFAAILLGLAVDYGMVLYQEWVSAPRIPKEKSRRAVAPSIIWSAITTGGAFFVLNLSGLPGLGQLGSIVGIGVILAAGLMLILFLAPFPETPTPNGRAQGPQPPPLIYPRSLVRGAPWVLTAFVTIGGGIFLFYFPPGVNGSAEALRPAASPAYQTLDEVKKSFKRLDEPLWLLVQGPSWEEVGRKLDLAEKMLNQEQERWVTNATLPTMLVPRPDRQRTNKELAAALLSRRGQFVAAAEAAGFSTNSVALLDAIFLTWRTAAASPEPYLPKEETGRWILQRVLADTPERKLGLGIVEPTAEGKNERAWTKILAEQGMIITSWELLGAEVFSLVKKESLLLALPLSLLVLLSLGFAYRNVAPVLRSLLTLMVAGILLSLIMKVMEWEWKLMNLMSLPLILGAGLDYTLHVQLSLRRHHWSIPAMRQSVGRALLLCALSTSVGFASLGWASNEGLASMGRICAAGILSAYLVAVWLLPYWIPQTTGPKEN